MFGYTIIKTSELEDLRAKAGNADELKRKAAYASFERDEYATIAEKSAALVGRHTKLAKTGLALRLMMDALGGIYDGIGCLNASGAPPLIACLARGLSSISKD